MFVWTDTSLKETEIRQYDTREVRPKEHPNYKPGQKVKVIKADPIFLWQQVTKKGTVIQCFKHHVLIQLKHYRECFTYEKINLI